MLHIPYFTRRPAGVARGGPRRAGQGLRLYIGIGSHVRNRGGGTPTKGMKSGAYAKFFPELEGSGNPVLVLYAAAVATL
jgi:hypothetical protein